MVMSGSLIMQHHNHVMPNMELGSLYSLHFFLLGKVTGLDSSLLCYFNTDRLLLDVIMIMTFAKNHLTTFSFS